MVDEVRHATRHSPRAERPARYGTDREYISPPTLSVRAGGYALRAPRVIYRASSAIAVPVDAHGQPLLCHFFFTDNYLSIFIAEIAHCLQAQRLCCEVERYSRQRYADDGYFSLHFFFSPCRLTPRRYMRSSATSPLISASMRQHHTYFSRHVTISLRDSHFHQRRLPERMHTAHSRRYAAPAALQLRRLERLIITPLSASAWSTMIMIYVMRR